MKGPECYENKNHLSSFFKWRTFLNLAVFSFKQHQTGYFRKSYYVFYATTFVPIPELAKKRPFIEFSKPLRSQRLQNSVESGTGKISVLPKSNYLYAFILLHNNRLFNYSPSRESSVQFSYASKQRFHFVRHELRNVGISLNELERVIRVERRKLPTPEVYGA